MRLKQCCGAKTRKGVPCKARGLANGRCRFHGGLSTGPRTREGRLKIAAAQRRRWEAWRQSRETAVVLADAIALSE